MANPQHHHRGPAAVQDRFTHSLRRRPKGNNRDYSAVNPFVKYILFGLNFLFLLAGIALGTMGTYILVLKGKTVSSALDFFFDPSCLICLVGCIMAFIAFFGCGGSLRESICFLKVYYYVLSIFLLLEIILVIFVFVFYFVDGAFASIGIYPEGAFKDAIRDYREDPDNQDFVDGLQKTFSCCGASNDEMGYKDWNDNPYFNCTNKESPEACTVPFSCCKINSGEKINYRCGSNMLDDSQTDKSAINTKGCLKGIQDVITSNIWIVGGVVLGVLLPQAFLICFAKALVSQIEEQMSKW